MWTSTLSAPSGGGRPAGTRSPGYRLAPQPPPGQAGQALLAVRRRLHPVPPVPVVTRAQAVRPGPAATPGLILVPGLILGPGPPAPRVLASETIRKRPKISAIVGSLHRTWASPKTKD